MKRWLSQLIMLLLASGSISVAHAATTSSSPKKSHHNKHHKKSAKKSKIVSSKASKNYMVGTASFYGEGDGFQGRLMADGKRFDTNDVYSAAHPTLPLGTKLMVTNLSNGRSIYVEVRDRMPREHRVIDLSVAAAKYLGMHHKGLTQVELVRVSDQEFEQNKRYLQVEDSDSGMQS